MTRSKTGRKTPLADYFRFSRSQRRAMVLMIVFSLSVSLLIHFKNRPEKNARNLAIMATGKLENLKIKEAGSWQPPGGFESKTVVKRQGRQPFQPASLGAKPDFFDPNTADAQTLAALGLSSRAISNIINYREKGGRFSKPEDLAKMYAIKPHQIKELLPYVRIEPVYMAAKPTETMDLTGKNRETGFATVKKPLPVAVDINLSDSLEWQLLPGIGAKRAAAILKYREKLGGFVNVEQVGETYGLPDSVFQKIKGSLSLQPGEITRIPINGATESELKAHPYIGWQWAKIIVAYRNQHGPFQSVDDLMKIHIIKKEWLDRVRPYLEVN